MFHVYIQQAQQISTDVSKYLAFGNQQKLSFHHLTCIETLKKYVSMLENQEVGPDGILSKLDNFQIRYCSQEVDSFPDPKEIIDRISLWMEVHLPIAKGQEII